MKKLVLKLDIFDDKSKQKAMKTVSTLTGIDSISMDMKEKKMTVIGTVDPVHVVSKLRKYWPSSDLITVGPAQEPEKKEEGKKEGEKKPEEGKKEDKEGKKEEHKKEEGEKGGGGGKEEAKKDNEEKKSAPTPPPDPVLELVRAYRAYNPQMTSRYYVQSMEENPNSCAIC